MSTFPTKEKGDGDARSIRTASDDSGDYLRQQIGEDVVLAKKMALINKAINDIGHTRYHTALFFLCGFGYAVDSMLVVNQSIAQQSVRREFANRGVTKLLAVSLSSAIGLLAGAVLWGLAGDRIGRKLAFNTSLFICAFFVVIAGAMPTYASFCAMVALYSAGAGGNYAIDATNYLEFLPSKYAFMTTILACWWGCGYLVTGLLAWAFYTNYGCASAANCASYSGNWGWRYTHFASGGIVLVLAVARLLMEQSPKWCVTQGRDAEAVEVLRGIALKYNRPFTLTLEQLESEGKILGHNDTAAQGVGRSLKTLFSTRKQAYATGMLLFLWVLIGIANPLYNTFRPFYLSSRGYSVAAPTAYIQYRNLVLNYTAGIFGPLLAWPLLDTPYIRRRGTLAIGAFGSMALLFGYTQVKNGTQNLAVSCVLNAVENIFFAALYGVTPELIPTASRTTGYGLAVAVNRLMNIVANIIATYANVNSVAPLFVCAGLFGGLGIVSLLLPFDPSGKQIG